jgi:transposase-like protein
MKCPRCGATMREEKRSFHKQRKWICPACNKVRMQQPKREKSVRNRREE